MENTNENKEMTAQESLSLITETLNNSRKEITRRSGKYFLLWGALLTFFSMLIYLLWKTTENEAWNFLWFALPATGIPLERLSRRKNSHERVKNDISRINGGIWASFGIFACAVAAFSLVLVEFLDIDLGLFRAIAAIVGLTPAIALMFGLAECISGIVLKNWAIKIAGLLIGIGGWFLYYITGVAEEQLLIFAFAGIVLVVTGLIVKYQYR